MSNSGKTGVIAEVLDEIGLGDYGCGGTGYICFMLRGRGMLILKQNHLGCRHWRLERTFFGSESTR